MRTLSNSSSQMSLVSVFLPPKCFTSPFELRGPCYKMTSRCTELVISEMPGVHFFPGGPEHSLSGNQRGYLQWQKAPGWDSWSVSMPTTPSYDNDHAWLLRFLPAISALSQFIKMHCPWVPPTDPELALLLWHTSIHPSIHHFEPLFWVWPYTKR